MTTTLPATPDIKERLRAKPNRPTITVHGPCGPVERPGLGYSLEDDDLRKEAAARIEALEAELRQANTIIGRMSDDESAIAAVLGSRYLDPPDGGCVYLPEQVRRMSDELANSNRLNDETHDALQVIGERFGIYAGEKRTSGILRLMEALQADRDRLAGLVKEMVGSMEYLLRRSAESSDEYGADHPVTYARNLITRAKGDRT